MCEYTILNHTVLFQYGYDDPNLSEVTQIHTRSLSSRGICGDFDFSIRRLEVPEFCRKYPIREVGGYSDIFTGGSCMKILHLFNLV